LGYLYRGVHGRHPQIATARLGGVIPGDPHGSITPEQHNVGNFSELSPYTSWTSRLDVAREHAFPKDGSHGVVLRTTDAGPDRGDAWRWEHSRDIYGEGEVLLLGIRMDMEVIEP
jgi:hypothetical protein